MNIRLYETGDAPAMAKLFCDTVQTICAKDYTKEQLDAWTSGADTEEWHERFSHSLTLIAESGNDIIGFANLDGDLLDMLYISKYYQRLGLGTELVTQLQLAARRRGLRRLVTFSSLTAKPFFLSLGWSIVRPNIAVRGGVSLSNYLMEKILS